ncbi:histidine kinase [Isoptericola halotolerans]|uniref:histidine kinase n=1 Tax=Isoptericola halotolerans TaxID=300560 RepID=UPI00388CFBF0
MSSTSPEPSPAQADEPDEHLLVDPARVRRAPRYRAFFTVGAVVGVVLGTVLGVWLTGIATDDGALLLKPGVFVSVIVLSTTTLGVLVAGALAVLADRRSLRRR